MHGSRDFADGIELKTLIGEILLGYGGGAHLITRVLTRGKGGGVGDRGRGSERSSLRKSGYAIVDLQEGKGQEALGEPLDTGGGREKEKDPISEL